MSSLFGKKTQNQAPVSSLAIQTSCQGLPIPIVWGKTRLSGNLIYYGDFRFYVVNSGGGGGKGGFLRGGSSTQTYYYQVAIALALCEGPIAGLGTAWSNSTVTSPGALNITLLDGDYSQGPWGYMSSLHADQALAYRGLAQAVAGPLQLGSSASLPNLAFEVIGAINGALPGLSDADPSAVIADLLTSANYGISFPTGRIGDLSAYTAYCRATGMLVSPSITDLTSAQDFVATLLEATNAEAVWSQGKLTIVPYGDQAIVAGAVVQEVEEHSLVPDLSPGNGYLYLNLSFPGTWVADGGVVNSNTGQAFAKVSGLPYQGQYQNPAAGEYVLNYADVNAPITVSYSYTNTTSFTPSTTPVYAFGDDDYVASTSSGNAQPVDIQRSAPQTQKNAVVVNYLDRSNDYSLTPTPIAKDEASIELYGLQQDSVRDYHFFCYPQAAQQSAQLLLGRQMVRNTYTFTVGQKYVLLDPMDLIALTDSATGLVDQLVRITQIDENDDLTLTIQAEDCLLGTASAPLYRQEPSAGFSASTNQDPGFVNAPIIFEPPSTLTGGDNELWVAVSGSSKSWGGCDVYVSYDDSTYAVVPGAHLVGAARMGVTAADLPVGPANDTTNTLSVDLSEVPGAEILSGTAADATNLATLCYVDGELLAYTNASMTAANKYALTGLVRGAYGTPISDHPAGKPFARLDTQIIRIPFNKALIGAGIFLKFLSFNIYGQGQQSLSEITPIEWTFGGGQPPGTIIGLAASLKQSGLAMTLNASWSKDALSTTYQADITTDGGTTWANVYQGDDTSFRADGLSAAATVTLRVRGISSSGLQGPYTSIPVTPGTFSADGSGLSNYVGYAALAGPVSDAILAPDLEADLTDLAAFQQLVQADVLATSQVGSANASITKTQQALATTTAALASYQTTVTAQFGQTNSSITSLQQTQASQQSTLATLSTTVTSNYTTLSNGLAAANTNIATNAQTLTTLSNQYGSLSTQVATTTATANNATANGQVYMLAQVAPSGVTAAFGVTLSVTGQQPVSGGYSLQLKNGQAIFVIQASQFIVEDPSNNQFVPFAISNNAISLQGVTYVASTVQSQSNVTSASTGTTSPVMAIDFVNGTITINDAS